MTNDTPTEARKPGCAYRLLTLLTVLLAVVGAGMAVRAVTLPPELAAQVSLSLPLEFVVGALWVVAFAIVAWRLLCHKRNAVTMALLTMVTFATYSVIRLLLFARADYDAGRLPFLWVTLGLLIAAVFVRVAAQWRRRDEFEREN